MGIQHVTAAKVRSPWGIEACPERVEGGEKDFCKKLEGKKPRIDEYASILL
jgi:hypothetical protein